MSGPLLKLGATVLTLAVMALSAAYVSRNVRDAAAPLHPPVLGSGPPGAGQGGARLSLTPRVRSADVEAVTSTYVS